MAQEAEAVMASKEVRAEGVAPAVQAKLLETLASMRKEVAVGVRVQGEEMEKIGKRASHRAMSYFQRANGFYLAADRMEAGDTSDVTIAYSDLIVDSKIEITRNGKILKVYTKDIVIPYKIQTMSKSINVPVGRFEVVINLDKRRSALMCQVYNLVAKAQCNQNQNHPHVDRLGMICWGDGQVKANKFCAENNFVGVLDMILYTLSHYNEGNPFIRLLRGWSWYMPLNERICWNCNLPVVKENVYAIPTLCQCTRYKCCHQLRDDGHAPDCKKSTREVPPSAPQSSVPVPADMEQWIRDTQERLARLQGASVPVTPPITQVAPILVTVLRTEPVMQTGMYQYTMLDAQVEMDNQFFAPPCDMMNAWVGGNAQTMQTTHSGSFTESIPIQVNHNNIRFTFRYDDDTQKVHLMYEGVNESANTQIYTTFINYADMERWNTQYHEHIRSL